MACRTWKPILALLCGCDGLTVPARPRQVKDPDGFVVACPDVTAMGVDGEAEGCSDLISCVKGPVDAFQTASAGVPQVNGVCLR